MCDSYSVVSTSFDSNYNAKHRSSMLRLDLVRLQYRRLATYSMLRLLIGDYRVSCFSLAIDLLRRYKTKNHSLALRHHPSQSNHIRLIQTQPLVFVRHRGRLQSLPSCYLWENRCKNHCKDLVNLHLFQHRLYY